MRLLILQILAWLVGLTLAAVAIMLLTWPIVIRWLDSEAPR